MEQKEVTIKNDKYQIQQFPGRKGLKLGKKVAKVALPAIGKAFSEDENSSMGSLMEVVADHLDDLDDETIFELLSYTTKNKMQIDFDKEFAGNYRTLCVLLWEIVQFNFSDLFFEAHADTEEN